MAKRIISASVLDFSAAVRDQFIERGLGVELSAFSMPEYLREDKLPQHIQETKNLLKDFPHAVSMHGAFYYLQIMARDPWIVDVAYRRCLQSLEIANELGINRVVFHANYVPIPKPNYQEFWVKAQAAFWQRLLPSAEKYGVQMLIENTREPNASYINDILAQLDSPNAATCFDTGHTNCFTKSGIPPREWVRVYGENLAYIHLHNNHGQRDEHLAFMDGTLDFAGFFEALEELETFPQIIIEVKSFEAYEKSYFALKELYDWF